MPYRSLVPGLGSKLRDAKSVNALWNETRPDTVVALTAGLFREAEAPALNAYGGIRRLVVCDNDPVIRAYWSAFACGGMPNAVTKANELWAELLAGVPDAALDAVRASRHYRKAADAAARQERFLHPDAVRTWAAWNRLRDIEERCMRTLETAAPYALCVMAGAIGGRRRRNAKSGAISIPYAPTYDPAWLTSRIKPLKIAAATQAWADQIEIVVLDSIQRAFETVQIERGKRAAITFDPPYGVEEAATYSADWTRAKLVYAIEGIDLRLSHVVAASIWCGPDDIDEWAPGQTGDMRHRGNVVFRFRGAKTHMKSAHKKKDGTVAPARQAAGGWFGQTVV